MRFSPSPWPAGRLASVALALISLGAELVSAQTMIMSSFAPQFTIPAEAGNGVPIKQTVLNPNATDAQTVCPGYKASGVYRTTYGFTAQLSLAGRPCNVYGTDIDTLNLTVQYQSGDRLRVNIRPTYLDSSNQSFYILPEYLVPEPALDENAAYTVPGNDLAFFWDNEPTFHFSVVRTSTGDVLFDTAGSKIVYENQFLEFVTAMPENYNLYGLSESIREFRLGNNYTKTFWNADIGDVVDANIYSTHPFYMDTRYYEVNSTAGTMTLLTANESNPNASYVSRSHILYNRNAHGQDILLRPNNVTWRALGGSMDLYFFAGPTAKQAIQQYQQQASGLPAMQQYWTFGFHQCRWGYENWTVMNEVVDSYAAAGIPLECMWNDIDYMKFYRSFQNDPVRFGYSEGESFFQKLRDAGQHYVPIIDSALYIPNDANGSDAYSVYTEGNSSGAFINNPDGSQYIGSCWPGYSVFPDFLSPGAQQWWSDQMVTFYNQIKGGFWSGIWIDLSEVSSFCVGSCGTGNLSLQPVHPPFSLPGEQYNLVVDYPDGFNLTNATEAASASSVSASQSAASASHFGPPATTVPNYLTTTPTAGQRNINYPPYAINNFAGDLATHGLSPNGTHHDGTLEYDYHNLWGLGILNATYHAILAALPDQRPFIIGRSTFTSAGKVAGHWGGDNFSKFYFMYISIPQALQLALAGMPMFGVDTCGFAGNADAELCSRWMQLSAFFPFYRNHNIITARSQEAYVWSSVAEASIAAMRVRFNLLPYMYTLFYEASTLGSTVMRALAWEFPDDPTLKAADRQFFLGPAILVTPALEPNISTVDGVFPGAAQGEVYYDWYTQTDVTQVGNVSIDAPLGHIPVFVRGGNVLAMQQFAMVTRDARNTPWSVLAALDKNGVGEGTLYLDDGVSVTPNATSFTKLAAVNAMLLASTVGNYSDSNPLSNVTVLGVPSAPHAVSFNSLNVTGQMTYNETSKVLVIRDLESYTTSGAWSNDWVLRWQYCT